MYVFYSIAGYNGKCTSCSNFDSFATKKMKLKLFPKSYNVLFSEFRSSIVVYRDVSEGATSATLFQPGGGHIVPTTLLLATRIFRPSYGPDQVKLYLFFFS